MLSGGPAAKDRALLPEWVVCAADHVTPAGRRHVPVRAPFDSSAVSGCEADIARHCIIDNSK